MMRYLLLIHADEEAWNALTPEVRTAMDEGYGRLAAEMGERGHLRGGDELAGAASAKVVRVSDGTVSIVDGPFAETREQLGGYFLVECDLETALGYAEKIPSAAYGAIEVRALADEH